MRIPKGSTALVVVALLFATAAATLSKAPAPLLTVHPAAKLRDAQVVRVSGTGFARNRVVSLDECAADATLRIGACTNIGFVHAASTGRFETNVVVHRLLNLEPHVRDCARARCVLTARSNHDDRRQRVELRFDPGSRPPLPTVTVNPPTGLSDRDLVEVTAHGFSPDTSLAVVECSPDTHLAAMACDATTLTFARSDGSGSIDVMSTVRASIAGSLGGTIDCRAATGTCVVLVENLAIPTENANAPLGFV